MHVTTDGRSTVRSGHPPITGLTIVIGFIGLCFISATACADEPIKPDDFWLRNNFGNEVSLSDVIDDNTEALVIIVLDRHCPIVNQSLNKISNFYRESNKVLKDRTGTPITHFTTGKKIPAKYPGDRVKVIGVYIEPDLGLRTMGEHVMDYSVPFPVFQDPNQKLITALGMTRLSEVTVLNRKWAQVYRGPFDDQFTRGRALPKPKKNWVKDCVASMLDGKETKRKTIKPEGCLITKPTKRRYPKKTFYQDVYPIIQTKCQHCHRDGEIGPMPFANYDDVQSYAAMIDEVIIDQRMPPFPAVSPREFSHDTSIYRLTEEEKSTLIAWLRGDNVNELGEPKPDGEIDYLEGDSSSVVERQWANPDDWKIGKPDFVFEMQEPFVVPASGVIDYVYYPVRIPQSIYDKYGDKDGNLWIEAIETKAGSAKVVHHIQVLEHPFEIKDIEKKMSPIELLFAYGPSADGAKVLGGFTPGNQDNALVYPKHLGMKISSGSNLLFELHYTPWGKETKDRSKVGIRFHKTKPKTEMATFFYFRKRGDFRIPARMGNHSMQDLYHFGPEPVLIHGMRLHQHIRGKSTRYEIVDLKELRKAGGGSIQSVIENTDLHHIQRGERLASVPVWDFNWQLNYKFEEPLILHPHQAILATGYWDNSKLNGANPDATVDVPWGQQTIHEMFNTLFKYEKLAADDPRLAQPKSESSTGK